jgi:inorganic pyrophosphatase
MSALSKRRKKAQEWDQIRKLEKHHEEDFIEYYKNYKIFFQEKTHDANYAADICQHLHKKTGLDFVTTKVNDEWSCIGVA